MMEQVPYYTGSRLDYNNSIVLRPHRRSQSNIYIRPAQDENYVSQNYNGRPSPAQSNRQPSQYSQYDNDGSIAPDDSVSQRGMPLNPGISTSSRYGPVSPGGKSQR
jgi:hypothetical protein